MNNNKLQEVLNRIVHCAENAALIGTAINAINQINDCTLGNPQEYALKSLQDLAFENEREARRAQVSFYSHNDG